MKTVESSSLGKEAVEKILEKALKDDVLKAGKIAGKARKNIELETGRPVVSSKNYLGLNTNKKIKA